MIETFGVSDVATEARLAQWRKQTMVEVEVQRAALYKQARDMEMNDPTNEEYAWLRDRGLRVPRGPVGGGAPQLPIVLATLPGAAPINSTFTTAQSIIGAGAAPGPAAVGPVGPFLVDYFKTPGASWEQEAMGIISTTVTPTIAFGSYFGVVIGTITTNLAITATITTASGLANVDWYYKVMGRTIAVSGTTATMLVTGILWGNIEALGATAATEPTQPVKNATPPTAVTTDLSTVVFLDIKATWGTSSASNIITCNFYKLMSLYS